MVDKDHQYKFIYKALYEYWSKKIQCSPTSSRFSVEEGLEEGVESDEYEDDPNYKLHRPFSFTD